MFFGIATFPSSTRKKRKRKEVETAGRNYTLSDSKINIFHQHWLFQLEKNRTKKKEKATLPRQAKDNCIPTIRRGEKPAGYRRETSATTAEFNIAASIYNNGAGSARRRRGV